jgi:hypothetical protein
MAPDTQASPAPPMAAAGNFDGALSILRANNRLTPRLRM